IAKYNLVVTTKRLDYGLIVAERNVAASGTGESEKLGDILNQQIVTQLRREPIVASASVDTSMTSHTIPKANNTTVTGGSGNLSWYWGAVPNIAVSTAAASVGGVNPSVPLPPADGNWGMKSIRVPTVWTILQRYRDSKPTSFRPKVAVYD